MNLSNYSAHVERVELRGRIPNGLYGVSALPARIGAESVYRFVPKYGHRLRILNLDQFVDCDYVFSIEEDILIHARRVSMDQNITDVVLEFSYFVNGQLLSGKLKLIGQGI